MQRAEFVGHAQRVSWRLDAPELATSWNYKTVVALGATRPVGVVRREASWFRLPTPPNPRRATSDTERRQQGKYRRLASASLYRRLRHAGTRGCGVAEPYGSPCWPGASSLPIGASRIRRTEAWYQEAQQTKQAVIADDDK